MRQKLYWPEFKHFFFVPLSLFTADLRNIPFGYLLDHCHYISLLCWLECLSLEGDGGGDKGSGDTIVFDV